MINFVSNHINKMSAKNNRMINIISNDKEIFEIKSVIEN
jgi:type III secretory pathway component EscU